jgi:hypothetical protein
MLRRVFAVSLLSLAAIACGASAATPEPAVVAKIETGAAPSGWHTTGPRESPA